METTASPIAPSRARPLNIHLIRTEKKKLVGVSTPDIVNIYYEARVVQSWANALGDKSPKHLRKEGVQDAKDHLIAAASATPKNGSDIKLYISALDMFATHEGRIKFLSEVCYATVASPEFFTAVHEILLGN